MLPFRIAYLLILALVGVMAGSIVRADVATVDLTKVPVLQAHALKGGYPGLTKEQRVQLKLPRDFIHSNASPGEDPIAAYQARYPFGEIVADIQAENEPHVHFNYDRPLLAVRGLTRPGGITPGGEQPAQTVWKWLPPKSMQTRPWAWSHAPDNNRFAVVAVLSASHEQRDPRIFVFDSQRGLIWQTDVPFRQTASGMQVAGVDPVNVKTSDLPIGTSDIRLGVTPDGSRTVVFINRPDRRAAFVFVYDGSGTLLRTVALPGYRMHWNFNDVDPSPTGRYFVVHINRNVTEADGTPTGEFIDEPVLIDADVTSFYRFGDCKGGSFPDIQLSDDEKVAFGRRERNEVYGLYDLPGAP